MPIKRRSRQSQRLDRLMRDPNGPQMKRIDTIVAKPAWEMFRDIRDSMNLTQRQALEYALHLSYLFLTLQGKISSERFSEVGAMLTEQSKRAANTDDDSEAGEPEPVE